MSSTNFYLGLDLGQAADFSALAVLERMEAPDPDRPERKVRRYGCRALKRWPLGTSYVAIADDVSAIVDKAPFRGEEVVWDEWGKGKTYETRSALAVDATGCGRPVVDMFRQRKVPACLVPVLITAGHAESCAGGIWHVAKIALISRTLALLEQGNLLFAPTLPEAGLLQREFQDYRVKVTDKSNETFNAREGAHDDLVLAVALAIWLGERASAKLQWL